MQSVALKGFHLSIQQARLWSWQREKLAYDTQCAVKLEGVLNTAIFQQALQRVVDRHAILRTIFQPLPGVEVPIQVILDHVAITCPLVSLEQLSHSEQEAFVDASFIRLQEHPFDLEHGPLLQCQLLRLSEQQHLVLLRLSALCGESTTLKLLTTELIQMYGAQVGEEALEEEPLQYADVSAWQEELLQEADAQAHQAYWNRIDLTPLPTLSLPFERQGNERTSGASAGQPFTPRCLPVPLSVQQQQMLEQTAQRSSVSLEALLLSGWQVLLWRLTETSPCVLGVSCDGRHYEELSACLGLYSRVVPLGLSLSPSLPFQR